MRERRSASCGEAPGKRAPRVSAVGAGAEEAQEHPSARTCSRLRRASRSSSEAPSSKDSPWPPRDSCSSFSSAQGSTPMVSRGEECGTQISPRGRLTVPSIDDPSSRGFFGSTQPVFQKTRRSRNASFCREKMRKPRRSRRGEAQHVAHADRETWKRCPSGTFERPSPACCSVSARFHASEFSDSRREI